MAEPFSEPLATLIRHTPPQQLDARNTYDKLPHANGGPVIFIGDACHPMSPFSGVAVSTAVEDRSSLPADWSVVLSLSVCCVRACAPVCVRVRPLSKGEPGSGQLV